MKEQVFEKLIPYCSEDFITIPLWEEGDYRWQMNLWYIVRFDTETSTETTLQKIDELMNVVAITVAATFDNKFDIYVEQHENVASGYVLYELNIMQFCEDITDETFVLNHNMGDYINVGVVLLENLERVKWV